MSESKGDMPIDVQEIARLFESTTKRMALKLAAIYGVSVDEVYIPRPKGYFINWKCPVDRALEKTKK